MRVIFARSHYDPVYVSETQNARRRRMGWDIPYCLQGSWGADFHKVAPLPEEVIVTKHRFDAFHGTDLELILRTNGVQNLVFAGRRHQRLRRVDAAQRLHARLHGYPGVGLLRRTEHPCA